jgi:hypothetical protein
MQRASLSPVRAWGGGKVTIQLCTRFRRYHANHSCNVQVARSGKLQDAPWQISGVRRRMKKWGEGMDDNNPPLPYPVGQQAEAASKASKHEGKGCTFLSLPRPLSLP